MADIVAWSETLRYVVVDDSSPAAMSMSDAVARVLPQHPTPQMARLTDVVAAYGMGLGLPLNTAGPGPSVDFDPGPGPVARISAASAGPESVSTSDGWSEDEHDDRDPIEEEYKVEAET